MNPLTLLGPRYGLSDVGLAKLCDRLLMSETPRVLHPNRAQLELRPTDLEGLLPEDHRARAV